MLTPRITGAAAAPSHKEQRFFNMEFSRFGMSIALYWYDLYERTHYSKILIDRVAF